MKRIVIIGASGHGKVVADIARLNGYENIVFLDDANPSGFCSGYPVIGGSDCIDSVDGEFFVAIGNAQVRERIHTQLIESGKTVPILIHPNAVIGSKVSIGEGSVIMAGAVVNPETVIGKGCIINTCSSVDHDNKLGDFVHVAVGAHLCGAVCIGDKTWIGAGATISNNVSICSNCLIGAGAVVVKNIEEKGTYVGVPVKKRYY